MFFEQFVLNIYCDENILPWNIISFGIVYVFANKESPENEIENLILSARVSSEMIKTNNNFI